MTKLFPIVASLLILASGPALAKDAKEAKKANDGNQAKTFFVAQDTSTNKCKVVRTQPDGTSLIIVGTSSYPTRDKAQAAAKDAEACK